MMSDFEFVKYLASFLKSKECGFVSVDKVREVSIDEKMLEIYIKEAVDNMWRDHLKHPSS